MSSTEVETFEHSSALEVLPPARHPGLSARQMLIVHAEMMQTAYVLASKMVNTTMVPTRFFHKPEDATAAILYGAELGLNPIQALQRVIPIHGMPSIEGRTMVALLKSRGYRFRWVEKSDERCELIGWDPKDPESVESPERSVWTMDRALLAEYVPTKDSAGKWRLNGNGKLLGNMKYITDPQAMLKAKCQAEVCRDLAPDVLLGISYTTEELESERWDSEPSPVPERAAAPVTVEEILGVAEPSKAAPEPARAQPPAEPEPEVAEPEPEVAAEAEPDPPTPTAPREESDEDHERAAAEPGDEELETHPPIKVRQLFALLAEGGIPGGAYHREDRLIVFRAIAEREGINSTNDLQLRELNRIIAKLKAWKDAGTLEADIAEVLWRAAEAEANAKESDTTTTEGE